MSPFLAVLLCAVAMLANAARAQASNSALDPDGTEFRASVISDLSLGDTVVVHADSEARGVLVLLRSRNHPEGFRYELLLTELTNLGKSYPITASLNTSFFDSSAPPPASSKVEAPAAKILANESPKPVVSGNARLPVAPTQKPSPNSRPI